ncbi:MAG: hypothetical protein P8J32_00865, partial [bacterium]|nr:hypothetical protein [bacterium]
MAQKISNEELRHKIVTTIREEGLDGIFGGEVVDAIQEKVKHMYKQQLEQSVFEDVPQEIQEDSLQETDMRPPVQSGPNQFPYEDDFVEAGVVPGQEVQEEPAGMTAGETPTEVPYAPTRADIAPVPEPLKNQEPGEIIVFDYNDVAAVSGEGLANKPFRTMDDPEVKKTIHDYWMQEGKSEVKVYAAKFEQIGTVRFDYQNGTAFFTDDKEAPVTPEPSYQENPYSSPSQPQIDEPATETDLRKSIESSVDLEATLLKVMKDILKDGLNAEPVVTTPTEPVPAVPPASPVYERQSREEILDTLKKKFYKIKDPKNLEKVTRIFFNH